MAFYLNNLKARFYLLQLPEWRYQETITIQETILKSEFAAGSPDRMHNCNPKHLRSDFLESELLT